MKFKKIKNDLFDIASRIKKINSGYFIVYNYKKSRFEVHNKNQPANTLSLVSPYHKLDVRLLHLVQKTSINNASKVLKEIEKTNEKITKNATDKVLDISKSKLKEIYKYAHRGKDFCYKNAFLNDWL